MWITLAASALWLAVNAVRPGGLPLVASAPYRTLVPCPEPGGPAQALAPDATELDAAGTYLIDARDPGSVFAITSVDRQVLTNGASVFIVRWPSLVGRRYTLFGSTNVMADPGSWSVITGCQDVAGTGGHLRRNIGDDDLAMRCNLICIEDGKIKNYQYVVPSTWNLCPRDASDKMGPVEESLIGTPVADPKRPLEVLRTVHSFDPCIACGVHVIDPDSNEVYEKRAI